MDNEELFDGSQEMQEYIEQQNRSLYELYHAGRLDYERYLKGLIKGPITGVK